MSAGTANIELVLEVRNKIKSGLSSVRKILSEAISSVRSKVNELKKDIKEMFSFMKSLMGDFSSKAKEIRSTIDSVIEKASGRFSDFFTKVKSGTSKIRSLFTRAEQPERKTSGKEKIKANDGGAELEASPTLELPGGLTIDPSELKTQAIDKFKGALGQSIEMAAAWRDGMAKVNETTKLSDEGIESLSSKVMDIAAKNPVPLEEAPDNFNKLVTAGLSAKDALAAFDPALKAVKAGASDMDTVVAATVATMNGTGIKDATDIMDTYFTVVDKGKVAFNDVAKSLPELIESSKQSGQSFKDTAGMFAFLTSKGLEADKATSYLKSTFDSISDPSIAKGLNDWGVKLNDVSGKSRPMLDVVGDLRDKFKGLTEEQKNTQLKAIGFDGEALNSVSSMISGYDELKGSVADANNGQGAMNEALSKSQTSTDVLTVLSNLMKQDMIELGSVFLPLLDGMNDGMRSLGSFIKENSFWIQVLGGFVLGAAAAWSIYEIAVSAGTVIMETFTAVQEAFTSVQEALNIVMAANPIMLIVIAVGALIGGLVIAYKHSQAFRATLSGLLEVGKLLCDVFMGLGKILLGALTFNPKMFFEGTKQLTSSAKEIADGGISKRFSQGKQRLLNEEKAEALKKDKELAKGGNKPLAQPDLYNKAGAAAVLNKPTGNSKLAAPVKSSIGNTTGKAEQVKSLTINMDAMVKMGDFVSTNPEVSKMSKRELEQWFSELCVRMIRNMEMSYS